MAESKGKAAQPHSPDRVMERLWLTYFNDTLYAKGVITESERNKMAVAIKRRSAEQGR